MVGMVAVVVLLVLALGVVLVVAVVRTPRRDDVHSVHDYHAALGTLEHLSDRIGPTEAYPVPPPGPAGAAAVAGAGGGDRAARRVPPVPVRGSDQFPEPGAPIVFDDARPVERAARPSPPLARDDRAQRIALDSMNRRRRPAVGLLVLGATLVLFVVLAVVGSHRGRPSAQRATSTTRVPTTTTRASSGTTTRTTPPPPTTLPAQFTASSTAANGTSATYTVPSASYHITVRASGACWIQAAAVGGSTLWTGVLQAGSVQDIPATGTATVQFGTPAVSLTVDHVPVVLPPSLRTPFVATFTPQPGAAPAPTTTTLPGGAATAGASS